MERWVEAMVGVFLELRRVLVEAGFVVCEVGEVRGGKVRMEELVIWAGVEAGLRVEFVFVNRQRFTKTANCWGISNLGKGTNSNRVVVFGKVVAGLLFEDGL